MFVDLIHKKNKKQKKSNLDIFPWLNFVLYKEQTLIYPNTPVVYCDRELCPISNFLSYKVITTQIRFFLHGISSRLQSAKSSE